MDWSGGLIWAKLDANKTAGDVLGHIPGHAVNLSAKAGEKFSNSNAALADLQSAIQAKFDPKAVFNPGLMG
jgi:glycolate oxidase FAD binding subunit